MRTWDEARNMLNEPPDEAFIKPPDKSKGIYGPYLEGKYVIVLLNDIFGTENWGAPEQPVLRETVLGNPDDPAAFLYQCEGAYIFRAMTDGQLVTSIPKPDIGISIALRGNNPIKPSQIETAKKGAFTDLIKRCARQLGAKTGSWLYFDEKEAGALFLDEEIDPRAGKPTAETDGKSPDYLWLFPGSKYKDMCADHLDKRGMVQADKLFELAGEEAFGYIRYIIGKYKFATGQYAEPNKLTAAALEKWLVEHGQALEEKAAIPKVDTRTSGETKSKATTEQPTGTTTGATESKTSPKASEKKERTDTSQTQAATGKHTSEELEAKFKEAVAKADKSKVAPPAIISIVREYMALAGYANKDGSYNGFQMQKRVRASMGNEHATLEALTVSQIIALMGYGHHLIEHGEGGKEYAQGVLARAWKEGISWKDACAPAKQGEADLEAMVKAINPKMTLADCEPVLRGLGWPTTLPNSDAATFFAAVKANKWELFDNNASMMAKAMATQWAKN